MRDYREVFLKLDLPSIAHSRWRLQTVLAYARTTNMGYYGLGNASHAEEKWAGLAEGTEAFTQARRFYQFDAATSTISAGARYGLGSGWSWTAKANVEQVTIETYAGSLLADHIASDAGSGQRLWGAEAYWQSRFSVGAAFDTRDHETVPTRGWFHDASVRCAPRAPHVEPYCGANVTLRGYLPIAHEQLSLAGRLVGDVVTSRAPLLELSRYGGRESGPSMGGSRGIRGVPQGRLQGRTKVLGNIELRSFLVPFGAADQRFVLGLAAFADAGRVWVDPFQSVAALDGTSFRLHWGAGGGPRVRWGDALVIRADVAYAPLGAEIGGVPAVYVDIESVM